MSFFVRHDAALVGSSRDGLPGHGKSWDRQQALKIRVMPGAYRMTLLPMLPDDSDVLMLPQLVSNPTDPLLGP